jgi:hypothetical protein
MNDNYEYRDFPLSQGTWPGKDAIIRLLQPLGEDAWEITSVEAKREFGPHERWLKWVNARRPHYGTPGPRSWEYTGFNISDMPQPWYDHIASRGWQMVEGAWYSYFMDEWYVFKRTDVWRGTDDGDILEWLEKLGFSRHLRMMQRLPWRRDDERWCKCPSQMITEILNTKWQLSAEAGYDVGTARAVESWRSSQ